MLVHLKIKPNSKSNQLFRDAAGIWVMKVKAPPLDGKANEEVINFLSVILKIPKSYIELESGQSNPNKKFRISLLSEESVKERLEKYAGTTNNGMQKLQ